MENQFIPYGQALELKELGFDEKCYGHYTSEGELNTIEDYAKYGADILQMINKRFNSETYMKEVCTAPLYQQAFKFFRDRYGYSYSIGRTNICVYHLMVQGTLLTNMIQDSKSYEESELKCIQAFIDAAKQNL